MWKQRSDTQMMQMTQTLDRLPAGWRYLTGALTAPVGYRWACNNKSRWSGEYWHALVQEMVEEEEVLIDVHDDHVNDICGGICSVCPDNGQVRQKDRRDA